jgi:dihydropteroate synthase
MSENFRGKNKEFSSISKLKSGSKLISLDKPLVMGILNISPDSFYKGSRFPEASHLLNQARLMISEGADILDIGAVSTRPFADEVNEEDELNRLLPAIQLLRKEFPDQFLSVDTWRSKVASEVIEAGADMINDISGGCFDEKMAITIAKYQKPFVIMHTKGDPKSMQLNPQYADVIQEIFDFFKSRIKLFKDLGVEQLILDPGFGFGKSVDHNYEILGKLKQLESFDLPILVGLSRKSMINKILQTAPEEALNGTTVLNTVALLNGANIIRVHDVKAARETIKLISQL